jgi:hypothetical protein
MQTESKLFGLNAAQIARFWSKVDRSGGASACWEWRAHRNHHGYGQFGTGKRRSGSKGTALAHRIAYALSYGDFPATLDVLHRCDNPCCCNPAHLFLGDHDANMADMAAKHRIPYGESHYHAKLTDAQTREIRRLYGSGRMLQREIGQRYGIAQQTVSKIVRGKNRR